MEEALNAASRASEAIARKKLLKIARRNDRLEFERQLNEMKALLAQKEASLQAAVQRIEKLKVAMADVQFQHKMERLSLKLARDSVRFEISPRLPTDRPPGPPTPGDMTWGL